MVMLLGMPSPVQVQQCEKMNWEALTDEQVILQAATWHEFINQKVVFIFKAITN
jgi:hypothetical protein